MRQHGFAPNVVTYIALISAYKEGELLHTYRTDAGDKPYFGELALMYAKPRAATVRCVEPGTLWGLDRSGFREDVNLVFPIDRLRELESEGLVGSVAEYHYSLMGAGWLPQQIEPTIAELAGMLRKDEVDAVCLVPI